MNFRKAKMEEREHIFMMGFDVWSEGLDKEKYLKMCHNSKKYQKGQWWLLEKSGNFLSSLITYELGYRRHGIGSMATAPDQRHKGFGGLILQKVVEVLKENSNEIFLFADIETSYYEKYHFKALPKKFQSYQKSLCMYYEPLGNSFFNDEFSSPSYF